MRLAEKAALGFYILVALANLGLLALAILKEVL